MFKRKIFGELHMDECDVMTVLKVMNDINRYYDGKIGNCGLKNEPDRWFILMHTTNKQWMRIINKLKQKGVIEINFTTGGQQYLYFKTEL